MNVLWGLWYAPLYSLGAGVSLRPLALLWVCAAALPIGVILSEVWRRSGHLGLTAACAGCYLAQAEMWRHVFPEVTPGLGGAAGLAGIAVWAVAAAVLCALPERN